MTSLLTGIPSPELDANHDPIIHAHPESSHTDFNFLVGNWKITNRKLDHRLAGSDSWSEFEATGELRLILLGKANTDSFHAVVDGQPFEGMTVRLFDPLTKLWSIYWSDSVSGRMDRPVIGSFHGNTGYFFTRDTFAGRSILMAFRWDKNDPQKPVWSQAFSPDNGKSWEWNWHMHFDKVG